MNLFYPFNKQVFLEAQDQKEIIDAIREAETQTSGEIRLYFESHCKYVNPLDRAAEIFWNLRMDETKDRNGVLIYIAVKDHQFAILGDKGIYEALGPEFWQNEVAAMRLHFQENHFKDAILLVIRDIGNALRIHFPYSGKTDKNELPDDIVFGN